MQYCSLSVEVLFQTEGSLFLKSTSSASAVLIRIYSILLRQVNIFCPMQTVHVTVVFVHFCHKVCLSLLRFLQGSDIFEDSHLYVFILNPEVLHHKGGYSCWILPCGYIGLLLLVNYSLTNVQISPKVYSHSAVKQKFGWRDNYLAKQAVWLCEWQCQSFGLSVHLGPD